jgi:hypothetical protein
MKFVGGIVGKIGLCIAMAVLSSVAFADTQGFFDDSDMAVIIVQGRAGDTDARNLFDVMTAPITDDGGFKKKEASFVAATGEKVFYLGCKISSSIQDFGSCTIVLYKSPWLSMGTTSAMMNLDHSPDSDSAARQFVAADSSGKIMGTADGRLSIRLDRDLSQHGNFTIAYR